MSVLKDSGDLSIVRGISFESILVTVRDTVAPAPQNGSGGTAFPSAASAFPLLYV